MKKLNLGFIGEIVSSPAGKACYSGTTISFYGKFKEGEYRYKSDKFTRENLIEAIHINFKEPCPKPSEDYFYCVAFQKIPEKYLYIGDT